jgi:hypothetical protein
MDDKTTRWQSDEQAQSFLKTVVYIATQFLEVPIAAFHLFTSISIPLLRDHLNPLDLISPLLYRYRNTSNMGKTFNPATDIPSLEGKVILVTGGT